MMSMGSDGNEVSSAKPNTHDVDDYVPELGREENQVSSFVLI